MTLKDRITTDMKTSLKAGDKVRTNVLRMLISEFKYAQAATNVHEELGDAEAHKVLAGYHKKLEKSLGDYPEGPQRQAIENEMAIVAAYMPQRATQEQVSAAIDEVLSATTERQFGPLMKQVLAKLGAGADGKVVSELLKARLSH